MPRTVDNVRAIMRVLEVLSLCFTILPWDLYYLFGLFCKTYAFYRPPERVNSHDTLSVEAIMLIYVKLCK